MFRNQIRKRLQNDFFVFQIENIAKSSVIIITTCDNSISGQIRLVIILILTSNEHCVGGLYCQIYPHSPVMFVFSLQLRTYNILIFFCCCLPVCDFYSGKSFSAVLCHPLRVKNHVTTDCHN